ncbi:MAG: bifunctional glycosyltransferase family 2 protein/CDP-glycerol:glycerophosphate glycerophosphotransferase, partial [Coriobacteriales bacterium]|nr:bifunctional glycosyltransferase family 2 protein/CDP-glycerol:glycerophosphate glycerophosphotransferase [Coriobacteriales bacterium]
MGESDALRGFVISVIIPVYNVEPYLAQSIESVVRQKGVDFQRDVQVILVNDGSTDGSRQICQDHRERFPGNTVYIEQENVGVSAARNRGLSEATGEYITFLDADDKISEDSFIEALRLFRECAEQGVRPPPFAARRLRFFDARTGNHMLNGKFGPKNRVVELNQEPSAIINKIDTCVFRRGAIIGRRFDERLAYGEDAKLLFEILLDNGGRYGLLAKPVHWFRKRRGSRESALDTGRERPRWYIHTVKHHYEHLFRLGREKTDGRVPRFVQFLVMYDLQWRFNHRGISDVTVIPRQELREYQQSAFALIRQIDDDIIMAQRYMTGGQKMALLDIKYEGQGWKRRLRYSGDGLVILDGVELLDLRSEAMVSVYIVEPNQARNAILVEGIINQMADLPGLELSFRLNGEVIEYRRISRPKFDAYLFDERRYEAKGFQLSIPLQDAVGELTCHCAFSASAGEGAGASAGASASASVGEGASASAGAGASEGASCETQMNRPLSVLIPLSFEYLVTSRLSCENRHNYRVVEGRIITSGEKGMGMRPYGLGRALYQEFRFFCRSFTVERTRGRVALIILGELARLCTVMSRHFSKKEVWLLSDRPEMAGDNGEALYRFIQKQGDPSIRPFFLINKSSPDYSRLKRQGFKLVNLGSRRHRLLFMRSDKVISAASSTWVINPWGGGWRLLYGLCAFDFVFLQHGTIVGKDLSDWLHRFRKDIKLFLTSATGEHQEVLRDDYGYNERQVKLLGLPRRDELGSATERIIAIMPSWRGSLAGPPAKSGGRKYNTKFVGSPYHTFYQDLLDDGRLH